MNRSALFREQITQVAAQIEAAHAEIHRTLVTRDRDQKSRLEWEKACDAFHSFQSPLDPFIDRACGTGRYTDKEILEFVVCFLEVDPWFFRSGYLKQVFLTRIKRSQLDAGTTRRLQAVLLDAVERRGTREFKYYCRLAATIADPRVVSALEVALSRPDAAVANRAKVMLEAIRQKSERRAVGA
jgi:hypothetical protein